MIRCRFGDCWPGTGATRGKGWQGMAAPALGSPGLCQGSSPPLGHPELRARRERENNKTWAEMPEKGRFWLSPVARGEGAREPRAPPRLRCSVLGVSETFPSQHGMFLSNSPGRPRLPAMALFQTKINLVFVCLLWQFS